MTELGRTPENQAMNPAAPAREKSWLILTDFASKYKISVSTLRRRIKTSQIKFKFEEGRYLLADEAPADMPQNTVAGQLHYREQNHYAEAVIAAPLVNTPQSDATATRLSELGRESGEEPILSTATRLLNELKRAYSSILHEKEEQMIQLKEEVSDLKTLVRVLESDNDRMRAILQNAQPNWI